jgi:radical SAM superfamily enzyme YgiQ (UPF0313 family)
MKTDVALVGRRLPDNENLGLGYLGAALTAAGMRSLTLVLNDVRELDEVASAVVESGAAVLGLSMPDGGSALAALALGEALRARGYRGHVTCGGPFATLARDWLLERYAWIDSVVRFAGEVPLVELVRAVQRGAGAGSVAGVTTRSGDGAPAPVCDLAMDLVPERHQGPSILGWNAAHVLATRGCEGRCTYCGPAALQNQELGEGRRAGHTLAVLREAGVGGVRRREVGALCEEMASLYHDKATRYFYFVDEHLLPYDEQQALGWLDCFDRELKKRRVERLGIGAMLRVERITQPLIERFAKAGLVRLFLGIEFSSDEIARQYGRKASSAHALRMLEALRAHDIAVVSNLMLVHPYATPASVMQDLDFVARAPAGVFETTRMMVYHGTRLCDRLQSEKRLSGNPLRHGYTFEDPSMQRFADIHARMRAEAFWDHSLAYRTHDTWLAARLARQLNCGRMPAVLGQELEAIRCEVNALYAASLRTAMALAQHGDGALACQQLVRSSHERSLSLLGRLERCVQRVQQATGRKERTFAPLRAAAASALVFSVAGAPACGGQAEAGSEPVQQKDASADGAAGHDASAPDAKPDTTVACTPDALAQERINVQEAVRQQVPCFAGAVQYQAGVSLAYFFTGYSGMPSFHPCSNETNHAKLDAWTAAAKAAADSAFAPCLLKQPSDYVAVEGATGQEGTAMRDAVEAVCPGLGYSQYMVIVDTNGTVLDVQPQPGASVPQDVLTCIKKALAGLTFPCYAGMTVCPEYAIAE